MEWSWLEWNESGVSLGEVEWTGSGVGWIEEKECGPD